MTSLPSVEVMRLLRSLARASPALAFALIRCGAYSVSMKQNVNIGVQLSSAGQEVVEGEAAEVAAHWRCHIWCNMVAPSGF